MALDPLADEKKKEKPKYEIAFDPAADDEYEEQPYGYYDDPEKNKDPKDPSDAKDPNTDSKNPTSPNSPTKPATIEKVNPIGGNTIPN